VLSTAPRRFDPGSRLWRDGGGPWLVVASSRVVGSGGTAESRLVRFEGIESPEEAAALRGSALLIDRSEVEPAPDGWYYPHELLGVRCVDAQLGDLGIVADIVDAGGGPLLVVRGGEAGWGEVLVPFVERFVRRLDREARRLEVDLPAGLVER
jgi:16S rRNA processing protein RimM